MRVFFIVFLSILLCFLAPLPGQTKAKLKQAPTLSAENYILLDELTNRVLSEKDAHKQVSVASITKVMTAVVALEYGDLSDRIKVSKEAINTNGSSIYLEEGEIMTLEDLLYGLMLRSGNDAAKVIAEHIGGSEEGFVYLMNETAAFLGMNNSHFMNPHGLDEDNHYSSAYDIAILMQYAMQNEQFQTISETESYHSDQRTYPWRNKNKLLTEKFTYTTGGKTGFTEQAGRTLVTTAEKDDKKLIAVTLNASDDWNDHISLYNWGFDTFDMVRLEKAGERDFITDDMVIRGEVPYEVNFALDKKEQEKLINHVEIYSQPQNEQIGWMSYYVKPGQPLLKIPIYEATTTKISFIEKWQQKWKHLFKVDAK